MPNSLTATGLTTATQAELLTTFTTALQTIYGVDITLDPDTPDGQLINIFIQAILDLEDLLTQIYNGFDPDNAIGVILDQRVAINGIQRQAGTFTTTNVTITNTQSVNLFGLDQTANPVYTVADSAGNQWQLVSSALGLAPGANSLLFQAANPGAVLTTPNTITVPVTVVLGVTTINNPTTYLVLGINEESDAALKIRRSKSVALSSQGYYDGLIAALENINGLTFAYVEENTGATANADGVSGHSIWVIVAGSAAPADIANAIYTKRNAGCGMYNVGNANSVSYSVTQLDGSSFIVKWDNVTPVPLYTKFNVTSLNALGGSSTPTPPNVAAIQAGLVTSFTPAVAAQVNNNELSALVQTIDPNTLVTQAAFSIETVQTIAFSAVPASGAFKLSYNGASTTSIAWNASAATIQSDLRALTGLSGVTVTGSPTSGPIVVTMTGVTNPLIIGANTNSLLTAGSAAVTLNFFSTFANFLNSANKNLQFTVSSPDIIILPMMLTAPGVSYVFSSGVVTGTTISIAHTQGATFTGIGGYGTLVYSISTSTGGTINASTGVYVAGTAGTDTLTLTDALGNSSSCVVTVT